MRTVNTSFLYDTAMPSSVDLDKGYKFCIACHYSALGMNIWRQVSHMMRSIIRPHLRGNVSAGKDIPEKLLAFIHRASEKPGRRWTNCRSWEEGNLQNPFNLIKRAFLFPLLLSSHLFEGPI